MRVASMFSGIGGIDLGFQQAGFDIVWANEFDHDVARTYRHNLGCNHLVEADIRTVNSGSIPDFDVLVAGFPCQPFSVLGFKKGFNDPRGTLFFEIERIAKVKLPKVIFLENVANLLEHNGGKSFLTIYNSLAALGYALKYQVIDAIEYSGIPQHRTRIYIVAFLNYDHCRKFCFPAPLPLTVEINTILDRSVPHHRIYYYNETSPLWEALKQIVTDKQAIYKIYDSGVSRKRHFVCPALTANMGTYPDRVPVILDDFGIRRITPLECLAFQGFPESYRFPGISLNSAYKQCGNSVVIPVIKRIAEQIMKALT